MTFYVHFALSNYRDPEHEKSLEEATRIYLALRATEESHGRLSHRQFTSFRCELRALTTHFPNANVCELTPAKLNVFFQRGNVGKKSFDNRRGLVGAFLKYCLLQGWIAANPTEKVPHYRGLGHRRGSALTLFVAKFRSLGDAALQAGNSESIIRKHYLDLKTTAEADEFFSIVPQFRPVPAQDAPPKPRPEPLRATG